MDTFTPPPPDPSLPVDSHSTSVSTPDPEWFTRTIARFIYNHNPLYVVSAALFLYGVRLSYEPGKANEFPWLLVGVLLGYTLLLGVTTYGVVRWGKVWEDARTILLLNVVLFLALSMIFDEVVFLSAVDNPRASLFFLGSGLTFALAMSETLVCCLCLRLPLLYRIPYGLTLGCFFGAPALLATTIVSDNPEQSRWITLAFPSLCALAWVPLWFAMRRGEKYIGDNGTPWSWPWYPMPLFVILTVGIVLRSYLLSRSFEWGEGENYTFGLYFLVPFLLLLATVILEMGLTLRHQGVITVGLLLPLVIISLTIVHRTHDQLYVSFLRDVTVALAAPTWLTAVATALFYSVAWLRGQRWAEAGLWCSLMAAMFIAADKPILALHFPRLDFSMVLVLLATLTTVRHPLSWRWVLFAWTIGGLLTAHLMPMLFVARNGAISLHIAWAVVLLVGLLARDGYVVLVRAVGAMGMVVAFFIVFRNPDLIIIQLQPWLLSLDMVSFAGAVPHVYLLTNGLLAVVMWRCTRSKWFAAVALIALFLSILMWGLSLLVAMMLLKGFALMCWALVAFVIAILITANKAGERENSSVETSVASTPDIMTIEPKVLTENNRGENEPRMPSDSA